MDRAKFKKGQQKEFLNHIAKYFDNDWQKIARIIGICNRTLFDWRMERTNISYEALLKLTTISNLSFPKNVRILPEYWNAKKAGRIGALKRYALYGNLGTSEGRRRGGLISQRKFSRFPAYAKRLGFLVRKKIRYPKHSVLLAEFIGIMLGDGGVTKYQIDITFNRETDWRYLQIVRHMIKKLFNVSSFVHNDISDKSSSIVVSSISLVEFLLRKGLKVGNKVRHQIGIPSWILKNRNFSIDCLKGLIDTDGSFYSYAHRVNGNMYRNYALDFTNHSLPLIRSVKNILQNLGCSPTIAKYKVVLHKKNDIRRYMAIVGTSNPRIKQAYRHSKIFS